VTRASYRAGVAWLVHNDDTDWAHHRPDEGVGAASVTACLLADLFGVDTERVRADVLRGLKKAGRS
jgi:hypothetical protein